MPKVKNKNIYWFAPVLILITLSVAFYFIGYNRGTDHFNEYLKDFKPLRKSDTKYSYISPLVGVDSPNAFEVGYHRDVKKTIDRTVEEFTKKGLLGYTVYYRELSTSVWFGINENEEFYPASLLKITVALAAYKQAEDNPGYLNSKLLYSQSVRDMAEGRNNEETKLVVGTEYTVDDLIRIMITNSDNGARDLLAESLDQKYVDLIFRYLDINRPGASVNYSISMSDYALFFRMLYSATFINEDHSEELLSFLTKSDFKYGITRDLPSDVIVAHKYGVFNIPKTLDENEVQELHECGIVYQADKPYLLCIMTKGVTQVVLADFIATLSKEIFEYSLTQQ
jgi:beta-lactamase class A